MRWLTLLVTTAVLAEVPASDSRNTRIPDTNTPFPMPRFGSLAEWESRKATLRAQILTAAGLDPMPDKSPLNAQVFGKVGGKDYSIEKVLIQTLPGYWLGGNLYRPVGKAGKFPGVVSPHGHWTYGRLEHTTLASVPARCINLARQGYVVFAYDMVGYNDTMQTGHGFGGKAELLWSFHALGLQTWNSIRAVDFLQSLPDVDGARIGATGASGGGTQTFLLAAIDDRVAAAAPVNMISGIMQGGSVCENAPGLRVGANNIEIGAMMAPRPLLMVSATGDWTRNTMEQEYPAVKGIFELYDRASLVEAVRIDAPHNYNKDSREAVYRFFAKHLKQDYNPESFKEQNIRLEKLNDMLALHGRQLPAGALSYDALFAQWKARAAAQVDRISDRDERRRLLRSALGVEWPARVDAEGGVLSRPGVGDRVAGVWTDGQGDPLLAVHPDGAHAARSMPEVQRALAANRPVLLIDAFQTGGSVAPRKPGSHFLTFNRSDDQARAQDVLTALSWLSGRGRPEVVATGRASVWCRFAAAAAPIATTLRAPTAFSGTDKEFEEQFPVPGIQRAGGWRTALLLTR
jgi:dienelactone hydrolase